MLIVDRELTVDLLVKNGFHAEQRALVIAESGYPEYLLPVAEKVLRENTDLPVFLLHDAGSVGEAMEGRLKSPGFVLPIAGHPLIDLGLSRADARKLPQLRAVRRGSLGEVVPIDMIAMSGLVAVKALGFERQTGIWDAIDEQRRTYGDTGSFG